MKLEMSKSKQNFVQIVESSSREGVDFSHDQNNHIKNGNLLVRLNRNIYLSRNENVQRVI